MPGAGSLLRAFVGFLGLTWTAVSISLVEVVGSEQQIPLSVVKLWASAFGGEIRSIAAKYSGSQLLQKLGACIVGSAFLCSWKARRADFIYKQWSWA